MKYYKVIGKKGEPVMARSPFRYHVPKNGKPGKWSTARKSVITCQSGFHACRGLVQLRHYVRSWRDWFRIEKTIIVELESQGKWHDGETKSVTGGPVRVVNVYDVDIDEAINLNRDEKELARWLSRYKRKATTRKTANAARAKKSGAGSASDIP